jgi:hypothetical protein
MWMLSAPGGKAGSAFSRIGSANMVIPATGPEKPKQPKENTYRHLGALF